MLELMGAKLDFQKHVISWIGREVPMKPTTQLLTSYSEHLENLHNHFLQEELEDNDIIAELYADNVVIKDRKYQAATPEELV